MKVYCYTPDASKPVVVASIRRLLEVLGHTGAEIITKDQPVEKVFPDTYRQIERRGESFLNYVDAMIVEGSEPDSEVGYLLAFAIAQKKPALLLLRKGTALHNPLATFGQRLPTHLSVCYYNDEGLEKRIISFLQSVGDIEYQEVPSIKFTLRITRPIEQYLSWKTRNSNVTKADFLRKVILDDVIAKDELFQSYQKKGGKTK